MERIFARTGMSLTGKFGLNRRLPKVSGSNSFCVLYLFRICEISFSDNYSSKATDILNIFLTFRQMSALIKKQRVYKQSKEKDCLEITLDGEMTVGP